MSEPMTSREALYALAVMSGVLGYCPKHEIYYRGTEAPDGALAYYDRYIDEVRRFFASPVAFYTALKAVRLEHHHRYCSACTNAVGFN